MPIGLVTGALVFGFAALLLRRPILGWSARHCLILAWLFWFPAAVFGLMDWQYFFAGVYLYPIKMKLILAGILFIFLSIGLFGGRDPETVLWGPLAIYILCFCCVLGLGWYGGNLVYGSRTLPAAQEFKAGMQIFDENCSGCHPRGGNAIKPNLPLLGAPELGNFQSFLDYLRNPRLPDGSKGVMPAFPEKKISDLQAEQLYRYITKVLAVRQQK